MNRRQVILLVGLGMLVLTGCSMRQDTSTRPQSIGPSLVRSTAPEFAEAAEAWRLLAVHGDQVWPGWGRIRVPLLVRAGDSDLLAGHPSPPQEFSALPDRAVAGQPVYHRAGHLVPVPAATAWQVGGVWSVAVPVREEFQRAIDAQLGKGVVQLDAVSYTRAIVHEAFHAHIFTLINGNLPDFGAEVNEKTTTQVLAAQADLDMHYAAEGRALVKAIEARDRHTARSAAVEFLALRRSHRATQDRPTSAYERATEWNEGLARYAEVAMMLRAGRGWPTGGDAKIIYPSGADIWQPFLAQLANPAKCPEGFRGRYYLLGAGQAFVLDRLVHDWKGPVVNEKQSLENALARVVH
jgi:hypothetical protein